MCDCIKALEDMTKEELEQRLASLENEEYSAEWQNEFTRQEIRDIKMMIADKTDCITACDLQG